MSESTSAQDNVVLAAGKEEGLYLINKTRIKN